MEKIIKKSQVKDLLTVGEISARSGVAISALHFYEKKGLIKPFRDKNNQRLYPRGFLRMISIIKAAQTIGFSLEEIQNTFEKMPLNRKPNEDDWENLSLRWREELNAKIEIMLKLRDHLDSCIGCGCLSLNDCPLRNQNDRLARKGSGPHLLTK